MRNLADTAPWRTTCQLCFIYALYFLSLCWNSLSRPFSKFSLQCFGQKRHPQHSPPVISPESLCRYRFFAFSVMIITVLVALGINGQYVEFFGSSDSGSVGYAPFWGFKLTGFGTAFTCAAFALTMHYNLPNSLHPVRNKAHAKKISFAAVVTAILFYQLVGATCAFFFNKYTDPLIVLNWGTYTGRDGGWGPGKPLWWSYIIQSIIMLFPILNLANDFPLVAITLASNLDTFMPLTLRRTVRRRRLSWLCVRLACVLPPLALASALGDLDQIFTFTGWFAFVLVFFIPGFYQWLSRRTMVKRFGVGADLTPYTGFYSGNVVVITVLIIGLGSFVFSIVNSIYSFVATKQK
eukprot:TRINITY_DN1180_c0_g3_i6.p1 TRINITY_DN1180_c0_g3~~TRINITY_DN1180_c0_g3_i6.p1  ORF type:complete len:351 (-),score=50.10 TRINITY_DN1180_c0_g3_i6:171-1223(-)